MSGHHARSRVLGTARLVIGSLAVLLCLVWVLALPARAGLLIFPEQVCALVLGLSIAHVFLKPRAGTSDFAWLDIAVAGVALVWALAVAIRFPVLSEGAFFRPIEAAAVGAVAIALILVAVHRVVGTSLVVVFAAVVLYALFGHLVPGALQGRSMAVQPMLAFLGTDSTALLGATLAIAAFVIVPFILFGRLLVAVGAGEVFDALAARLAGRGPGGAARVTVVSSMLFGTVSGSAVANVMANGVVTIGLMKRNGYPARTAAAIEATSSTGGQIMPPVMGAAAFVMAEMLRVPYAHIMLAAILPAALFYAALLLHGDFTARKLGLPPLVESIGESLARRRVQGFLLGAAFAGLILGIFQLGAEAELAAVWVSAGLALAGALLLRGDDRLTPRRLVQELAETGSNSAEVVLICGLAGMIIGLLQNTGLAFALSLALLEIGKVGLFALLATTALVSIVLGMGMPTTAVYLLLSVLAAPTLVQIGVPGIAAHMFVFYFGMLSMITPPVALASFAAASLAGSDPMRTALESVRVGWVTFVIPFMFVYQPALLGIGSPAEIVALGAASLLAVTLCCAGFVGHALAPLSQWERVAAVVIGALILMPENALPHAVWIEVGAGVLGVALIARHVARARAAQASIRHG